MKKIIKQIAGIAMALVVGVSLVGCGTASPDKAADKTLKELQSSLKSIAKELKEGKDSSLDKIPGLGAVASAYKGNSDAIKVLGEFADKMSEFEFKIGDVKKDGDRATVKVTIKTYDFGNGVKKAAENAKSKAESLAKEGKSAQEIQKQILVDVFKDMISNATDGGKSFSREIEIKMAKTNKEWKIDTMSVVDINNAVLADMQKAAANLK